MRVFQQTLGVVTDLWVDLAEGGNEIAQEASGIIVILVEREPAQGYFSLRSHWVTKVVLPKPAGADTMVSLRRKEGCSHKSALRRSSKRWRGTNFSLTGGKYNFIAKSGVAIVLYSLYTRCR